MLLFLGRFFVKILVKRPEIGTRFLLQERRTKSGERELEEYSRANSKIFFYVLNGTREEERKRERERETHLTRDWNCWIVTTIVTTIFRIDSLLRLLFNKRNLSKDNSLLRILLTNAREILVSRKKRQREFRANSKIISLHPKWNERV